MRSFFRYNRNERRGMIALIIMLLLLVYFRYRHLFQRQFFQHDVQASSVSSTHRDTIQQINRDFEKSIPLKQDLIKNDRNDIAPKSIPKRKSKNKRKEINKSTYHLHKFDPNKVTYDELLNMGISKYASKNWIKYMDMGGQFRSIEQIKSIYGLTDESFNRIVDYVDIPEFKKPSEKYPSKLLNYPNQVDVNLAGEQDWKELRGIGDVLSKRIVKFRNSLGGFHSIEQVALVYGIEDSLFQSIKPLLILSNAQSLEKIKINQISEDSLKKHPFFTWKQAKLCIAYRNQHGAFLDFQAFKNLRFFKAKDFNRIKPYLSYEVYNDTAL